MPIYMVMSVNYSGIIFTSAETTIKKLIKIFRKGQRVFFCVNVTVYINASCLKDYNGGGGRHCKHLSRSLHKGHLAVGVPISSTHLRTGYHRNTVDRVGVCPLSKGIPNTTKATSTLSSMLMK